MDETTKVIIATLSGFIIAFFAEPVKIYFQNRAKLKDLRLALYKELIHNWILLTPFAEDSNKNDPSIVLGVVWFGLRTECYKKALENELPLFYRLDESSTINMLHVNLAIVRDSVEEQEKDSKYDIPYTQSACKSYVGTLAEYFWNGLLLRNIAKKQLPEKDYLRLLESGRDFHIEKQHPKEWEKLKQQ